MPRPVMHYLDCDEGDHIYYFMLSDGTINMMSESTLKERLGKNYEQMLPEHIVDLD